MENKNMTKCKACGKDIAKGTKKCVHCGKDQRSFFRKHKIITGILVLVLIGAIGSALGGDDDTTEPAKQAAVSINQPAKEVAPVEEVAQIEEVITISAEDLAKEYEENEVRADKNYKGKVLEISGTVKSIGVSFSQTYIVLSSGKDFSITDIQCFFKDKAEIDMVADLDEGDVVTLTGKVSGKSLNVSVENCTFNK